ncbi:protein MIZU-KUSSEI 1 [Oryza brachyantha]|uniref:DUF617 domain-containing protein n=1 Tax=Oryza brachyantha TaxID=4533 RepID=J3M1U3_ORYBR|nr:protein MIZU-KUSSEI 1 [Oryza brachyantha]
MADAVVDYSRRMRPDSLSSSVGTNDDGAVSKNPVLRMTSPSPTRAATGRALEAPPMRRRPGRRSRPVRMFHTVCRSLPVLTPRFGRLQPGACRIAAPAPRVSPSESLLSQLVASSSVAGTPRRRMTGTLFGYRNDHIALSLQDNPRCLPTLVVELALPTHALLRDLGTTAGARIVLESEKHAADGDGEADGASWKREQQHGWVLDEPTWTMSCNGKRVGYAVRRDPTDDDIAVLETLWAVSMGGGVLPGMSDMDGAGGEMAYMRGCFEHIIGSRDSESLYMVGPHGGDCPELAVFFVRL